MLPDDPPALLIDEAKGQGDLPHDVIRRRLPVRAQHVLHGKRVLQDQVRDIRRQELLLRQVIDLRPRKLAVHPDDIDLIRIPQDLGERPLPVG